MLPATQIMSSKLRPQGGEEPYLYHRSGNFGNLANFGQLAQIMGHGEAHT